MRFLKAVIWVIVGEFASAPRCLATTLAIISLVLVPAGAQLAQAQSEASAFPLQAAMRVAHEPAAFPSAGRMHVFYELYLTNFSSASIDVRGIDVLDDSTRRPVATFEGQELGRRWQSVGSVSQAGELPPGGTAMVFISIPFGPKTSVPQRLVHRVVTDSAAVEGAMIAVHHASLVVGPPVRGADWLASDAPGVESHHWRQFLIVGGKPQLASRYAIDWMQVRNGALYSGDERKVHSFFSFGKPVLAVADAIVIHIKDGLPDNVPGHFANYHPAVQMNLDTIPGNTIVLDLGNGLFAHYMHLEAGSLRVKVGDHVRRGEVLARIGCSGDARGPHLHFQISSSPQFWAGEGVPYLIGHFRIESGSDVTGARAHELPLDNFVVDFAPTGPPRAAPGSRASVH